MESDSPTAQGYSSVLTSSVKVVKESDEVQVRRETRSYFCELIAVIVKVSSKRSGSDIVAVASCGEEELDPDIAVTF